MIPLGHVTETYVGHIIEDGKSGFATSPTISATTDDSSYGDDYRLLDSTSKYATWTFANLSVNSAGAFDIYLYRSGSASNASYTVYINGSTTPFATFTDNSTDSTVLGAGWYKLGTVNSTNATEIKIKLVGTTSGLKADAICLLQKNASYTYDAVGNVLTATNATGRVTAYEYDHLGRVVMVTQPNPSGGTGITDYNPITHYVYDAAGRVSATINSDGTAVVNKYDYAGRVIATYRGMYVDDCSANSPFSTTGTVTRTQDATAFDGDYRMLGSGNTATWTFTDAVTDVNKTYYVYVSSKTAYAAGTFSVSNGSGTSLTLTALGSTDNPASLGEGWTCIGKIVDYSGQKIVFSLVGGTGVTADAICLVYASAYSQYVYDTAGNMSQSIGATGYATNYYYDYMGRLYKVKDPAASSSSGTRMTTTYSYDTVGRTIKIAAPSSTAVYTYDYLGRKASQNVSSPTTTYYQYDALGNLRFETFGYTTEYVYDRLGRLLQKIGPDADGNSSTTDDQAITTYTYDLSGRVLNLSDTSGDTTTYTYDYLGRQATETNELGDARYYSYDADGRLVKKVTRNGEIITYAYDCLGRISGEWWYVSQDDYNSDNWYYWGEYLYNAFGKLQNVCTYYLYNNFEDYSYTNQYNIYDGLGRLNSSLVEGDLSSVTMSYTYYANDLRKTMTEYIGSVADSVTSYTYDRLGRVSSIVQQTIAGSTSNVRYKSVSYAYDATTGLLSTLTRTAFDATDYTVYGYPGGDDPHYRTLTTGYTYDSYFRMTGANTTGCIYTIFTPPSTLNYYYYEGVAYTYGYNALNQLTSTSIVRTAKNNASNTFTYTESHSYAYDNAGQLKTGTGSYSYDADGNRTNTGYQTGDDNRLTTDGTNWYLYDDEGNLTEKFHWTDADSDGEYDVGETRTAITSYTYDSRNRLSKVAYTATDDGITDNAVDYFYDAFNRRIETLTDTDGDGDSESSEFYIYDGDNIVLDFLDSDGTGTSASTKIANRYVWGLKTDELLVQDHYTSTTASKTFWMIADRQGSIRDAMDGSLIAYSWYSSSYNDYGAMTTVSGRTGYVLPSYIRFTYTCQERETSTAFVGLYYYNNRWYDSSAGRFISQDPLGFAAGDTNLYRYCDNDPINFTDPTGWLPNLCSPQHSKRNVKVDRIAFKQAMSPTDPGTVEELTSATKILSVIDIIITILDQPAAAAYPIAGHSAVDKILEVLPEFDEQLMKTNGVAVWVHVTGECCECERHGFLWLQKRLNWQDKDGGWTKWGKQGAGKQQLQGWAVNDKAGIAAAVIAASQNAVKAFLCP